MEHKWYDIPGFSKYEINEYADIRRKDNKEPLRFYIRGGRDGDGYKSVSLMTDYGSSALLNNHLIACTIFHGPKPEKTDEIKQWTCNHKDGDKLNCYKDNLEWVSNSGNIRHALTTGLNKSSQHVRVTNTLTNERLEFFSLRELTRWMGNHNLSGTAVVNKYKHELYKDIWKIEVTGTTSSTSGDRTRKRLYGKDTEGEICSFASGHECSGITGVSRRSIGRSISSNGKRVVNGWRFSYNQQDLY